MDDLKKQNDDLREIIEQNQGVIHALNVENGALRDQIDAANLILEAKDQIIDAQEETIQLQAAHISVTRGATKGVMDYLRGIGVPADQENNGAAA